MSFVPAFGVRVAPDSMTHRWKPTARNCTSQPAITTRLCVDHFFIHGPPCPLPASSVLPPSFLRSSSVVPSRRNRRKDGGRTEEGRRKNGGTMDAVWGARYRKGVTIGWNSACAEAGSATSACPRPNWRWASPAPHGNGYSSSSRRELASHERLSPSKQ